MTPSAGVVVRCVRLSSTLQPYLDGEITDPAHLRAMADHLEECRRCGLEAETYTTLKVALAARAPGPADDTGTRAAVGRLEAFARSLAGPAREGTGPRGSSGTGGARGGLRRQVPPDEPLAPDDSAAPGSRLRTGEGQPGSAGESPPGPPR